MDKAEYEQKLAQLKQKRQFVDDTWKTTGNRNLLNFIIDLSPKLFSCERASIFIQDPESNSAWIVAGTDMRERQIVIDKKESLVGLVMHKRITIKKFDMLHQQGAHMDTDMETGFTTRNAMAAPILDVAGERVVGAVELLNKCGDKQFNDEDERYLTKVIEYIRKDVELLYQRQELVKISQEIQMRIKLHEANLQKIK